MPFQPKKIRNFSVILLKWNREVNSRQMPWKGEKDPYKIWLSEIILQQTRVEQGLRYYLNFVQAFPDVRKLASASEEKVFKLWEGLGYYSRCRNLIATARYISSELGGKFPDRYEAILALKGIGPYTAAAIGSFAFNLPHAVLDGNVFRVLSRVFGIDTPTDTTEGKKKFTELAYRLLDTSQAGAYNQAIMDFGAMVCKPVPLCAECPFRKSCFAYQHGRIAGLPVKEKKLTVRKRWFYYFVMEYDGKLAIRQRTEKDIWQQLYEFPMIESPGEQEPAGILTAAGDRGPLEGASYTLRGVSGISKQQLSHQTIFSVFIEIRLQRKPSRSGEWIWMPRARLADLAFPKTVGQYLAADPLQGTPSGKDAGK